MIPEANHLIDDFRALPDESKREVLAELLLIAAHVDYPEVADDELLTSANEVFLAYDDRKGRARN